jgi:hypothetical protein
MQAVYLLTPFGDSAVGGAAQFNIADVSFLGLKCRIISTNYDHKGAPSKCGKIVMQPLQNLFKERIFHRALPPFSIPAPYNSASMQD